MPDCVATLVTCLPDVQTTTDHAAAGSQGWRFGRFELQPDERRLLVDGEPVTLGARAFDVLVLLAEQAGHLVTKNQLMDRVWPGVIVEEHNIATQVSGLRKVLGGDVITTVPGRGYRFTARLLPADAGVAQPAAQPAAPAATRAAVSGSAAPRLRTNLPATLTALIGREAERQALQQSLERHRLVTLIGAGGNGKSLLAQHVLQGLASHFVHGVCWVDLTLLAPGASAADIAAVTGAALGVVAARGDALAGLAAAAMPMEIQLVLDNAEHLLAATAEMSSALLAAAPGLRLLVTSQAPLRLADEVLFRLDGLAQPAPDTALDDALAFGAVALFVERARALDRRFTLDAGNTATVCRLCSALDGSPLAIELAAARLPLLGLSALARALNDRLALLTRGAVDRPERQQALRATLDWTHGLLGAEQQAVFRRLAVFVGAARLDAIEAVAAGPQLDRWAVVDALADLVDRSLVAVVETAAGPRYRLLETPRAYAVDQLHNAGEGAQVRDALAAWAVQRFLDHIALWTNDLETDDEQMLNDIGPDCDHALAAFDHCVQRAGHQGLPGDAQHAAAVMAVTLGHCLIEWLPLTRQSDLRHLVDGMEPLLDRPCVALPPALQVRGWRRIATAIYPTQPQRSARAASRALEVLRLHPGEDALTCVIALEAAAEAAARSGDAQRADELLAEADSLIDPAWSPRLRINHANARRRAAKALGRMEQAIRFGHEHLAQSVRANVSRTDALAGLAETELAAGRPRDAVATGSELVAALEGTRSEQELAFARMNLCAAHLALDEVEAAMRLVQQGWPQAARFGMQAWWTDYLALLAALQRRWQSAALLLGFADAFYERTNDRREPNEARAHERTLGMLQAQLPPQALSALRTAGALLPEAALPTLALAL